MPLYQALKKYYKEKNCLLHMPGHKGGQGFNLSELTAVGSLDFTEVSGLDDLHYPTGAVMEAQKLAARAWGAGESLFLVNGATSGLHSLVLALGEKATVIIPRNAHRSLVGGLILSGARPVYLECVNDPDLNIAVAVKPEEIRKKVKDNPEARAVFLISPTYYGTVNEMTPVTEFLAQQGIPLLVDEAHGGHLAFHPDYPDPALAVGASACVHGLHKTLPVLTQAGLLHLKEGFFLNGKIKECWDHLTSTSPSYPLMTSIDYGRALMEEQGQALLEGQLNLSNECRRNINSIPGLACRSEEFTSLDGVDGYDPLKILVEIRDLDITAEDMERLLRKKYRIQVEFARTNHLLAMFSPVSPSEDWRLLASALKKIAAGQECRSKKKTSIALPPIPPMALTPRQAFLAQTKSVNIKESAGLISGEMVAGYPPGIPCLMPGETITAEIVEYMIDLRRQGTPVHGLKDRDGQNIEIINSKVEH
ncbi:MAG: aminotransferase class I/II-fold pyridoxal phosphate-dependent enzyme [Chitinophagales bacterium]